MASWADTLEVLLRDMLRDDNQLNKVRTRQVSDITQGVRQLENAIISQNQTVDALRVELRHLEQELRNEGVLRAQYRVTQITENLDG